MDGDGSLTGEASDVVIVIVWCCCVSSSGGVFVFSSVERRCSNPVAGDSGWRPLSVRLAGGNGSLADMAA